jgi:hypothetical protein
LKSEQYQTNLCARKKRVPCSCCISDRLANEIEIRKV